MGERAIALEQVRQQYESGEYELEDDGRAM